MLPTRYDDLKQADKERLDQLLDFVGTRGGDALEIGARSGIITRLLKNRFEHVTALDLARPPFSISGVTTVAGDVTDLQFDDRSFDTVICAEVLEHISPHLLQRACDELTRVTRARLVVGVPYKQDLRQDRTTCRACDRPNPPYGHVNSFDEERLLELFPRFTPRHIAHVGRPEPATNAISTLLMDWARNPWGSYAQEEPCIHCGTSLMAPARVSFQQQVLADIAMKITALQNRIWKRDSYWIHVLFERRPGAD